jgi:hypothetical protein
MRDIAHADCEESFQTAVTSLTESEDWNAHEHFRVWFEKQWLSAAKVSFFIAVIWKDKWIKN